MDCFIVRNMSSNSLLLEQYIIWDAAVQMSCKLREFMPGSSERLIQAKVQTAVFV